MTFFYTSEGTWSLASVIRKKSSRYSSGFGVDRVYHQLSDIRVAISQLEEDLKHVQAECKSNAAGLFLSGQTRGALKQALVLTVISNTSDNPISGTFSNLPDGGIVTVNNNNLQASCSDGDRNDLTQSQSCRSHHESACLSKGRHRHNCRHEISHSILCHGSNAFARRAARRLC